MKIEPEIAREEVSGWEAEERYGWCVDVWMWVLDEIC
jgi:hypothetical protein